MTVAEKKTDLELIAQRVIRLSEIATLEHLEMLLRSQAEGMLANPEAGQTAGGE